MVSVSPSGLPARYPWRSRKPWPGRGALPPGPAQLRSRARCAWRGVRCSLVVDPVEVALGRLLQRALVVRGHVADPLQEGDALGVPLALVGVPQLELQLPDA